MSEEPGTSEHGFVPAIHKHARSSGPRFQRPVASLAFDYLRLGAFQLLTVGGAAALAKTAVAPLERVKVRRRPLA